MLVKYREMLIDSNRIESVESMGTKSADKSKFISLGIKVIMSSGSCHLFSNTSVKDFILDITNEVKKVSNPGEEGC